MDTPHTERLERNESRCRHSVGAVCQSRAASQKLPALTTRRRLISRGTNVTSQWKADDTIVVNERSEHLK